MVPSPFDASCTGAAGRPEELAAHAAVRVIRAQEAAVQGAAARASGGGLRSAAPGRTRGQGRAAAAGPGGADVGARRGWQHSRGGRAGWGLRSGPAGARGRREPGRVQPMFHPFRPRLRIGKGRAVRGCGKGTGQRAPGRRHPAAGPRRRQRNSNPRSQRGSSARACGAAGGGVRGPTAIGAQRSMSANGRRGRPGGGADAAS